MYKNFIGHIEESESNLWGSHIKVPKEIVLFYKEMEVKRLICRFNESTKIHCAIMPSSEGPYILINKPLKKQLCKIYSNKIPIELSPDNSKYGMEMPVEFEQCLIDDGKAINYFELLTPGKQRNLIHLVNTIKNPEIRIRRALAIVEHLNRETGQLDFKKLNELIKEYNQRFKL
jgi:hypothetical protein